MVRYDQSTGYTTGLPDRLASSHSARYFSISVPQERRNLHNSICLKGHTDWSWAVTAIHKLLTWVALMNEEHEVKKTLGGKYRGNKHFAQRITNLAQGQGHTTKNKMSGSLILRVGIDGSNQEAPFKMSVTGSPFPTRDC